MKIRISFLTCLIALTLMSCHQLMPDIPNPLTKKKSADTNDLVKSNEGEQDPLEILMVGSCGEDACIIDVIETESGDYALANGCEGCIPAYINEDGEIIEDPNALSMITVEDILYPELVVTANEFFGMDQFTIIGIRYFSHPEVENYALSYKIIFEDGSSNDIMVYKIVSGGGGGGASGTGGHACYMWCDWGDPGDWPCVNAFIALTGEPKCNCDECPYMNMPAVIN